MKSHTFFSAVIVLFLIELTVFILYILPKTENEQDTVAVNEVVQTVQDNWKHLDSLTNPTTLDYVVIDLEGTVLYKTKSGLSENLNMAIRHKDTILDVQANGTTVGKLIIYNNDRLIYQSEKQTVIFAFIAVIFLQFVICAGFFFYMRRAIIQPFHKLKEFAKRVASGNLDIPLEMDRQNVFGAFTESFDIMRCELKKAKIAEAKANESKKELVAKLSHDIKTPIASIKAASEVGAALSSDKKNRENYGQIIQKADQINTLVTNLFSATLEELQELPVKPSNLKSGELRTLLENADYLHRAVIPSVPDCLLFADRLRLQQVFDNVFANSYKYANTPIDVTVLTKERCLTVIIEDYGGGINEAELPFIKEKFRRGSNTKNIEGAGLGLYISDYCMREMKGRLDMENGSAGLRVTIAIALSEWI